jgi:ElaB/YqjD/DUF883 family membrane-anchored ribosome-binding protein
MTQQSEMNQQGESRIEGAHSEGERQAYGRTAMEQTGKLLRSLSQKVRSVAESLREEEGVSQQVGKSVERVARRLESSADYLSGATSREIQSDVRGIVQRYPMRSLGVLFGVGLLLGAALRRRGI